MQGPSAPDVIETDLVDDGDTKRQTSQLKEDLAGLQRKCTVLEAQRDRAAGASEEMREQHTTLTVRFLALHPPCSAHSAQGHGETFYCARYLGWLSYSSRHYLQHPLNLRWVAWCRRRTTSCATN